MCKISQVSYFVKFTALCVSKCVNIFILVDTYRRVPSVLLYFYIWKTVLPVYIPIFQGKQEMLNSYLKQMLLISNKLESKSRSSIGRKDKSTDKVKVPSSNMRITTE